MILFNTLNKAKHYVRYKNSVVAKDPYYIQMDECYEVYHISKNLVIKSWGYRCGCGCGAGTNSNLVIGRVKSS